MNIPEVELSEYPELTPLDFWLCGCMKREGYKRRTDAQDELLTRILDAAARIKESYDQLGRKPLKLRTRIAKCLKVEGRIFESLLSFAKTFSLKHYIKIQILLTVSNFLFLYNHSQCLCFCRFKQHSL